MDFATAKTNLNVTLGDTGDITFSDTEKTRALTKAWNDAYVVGDVWDTSLTYTQGTYQYTLPAALTTLQEIAISLVGDTQPFPEPIDTDLWDLINGKIQFSPKADYLISSGAVLYLKGHKKLTTSDNITNVLMQEYVIALAGYNTLTLLTHKKANLFVKNDTSMGELITLRRELLTEAKELRARLPKFYESA